MDDDEFSVIEDELTPEEAAPHDQEQASDEIEMDRNDEELANGPHSSLNHGSQTSTTGTKQKSTQREISRKRTLEPTSSRRRTFPKIVPSTRGERAKRRHKSSSDDEP